MAISIWKCLEKRDGRTRFRQRAQNIKSKVTVKCPKYENTFRLESYKPFRPDPVDDIVKTMMENRLEDITYDSATAPTLCGEIAAEIRKKIMKLEYDRYKILVVVTIIEKASQSLKSNLGFLWDIERDNCSTYSYETQSFFASCFVVGSYCE